MNIVRGAAVKLNFQYEKLSVTASMPTRKIESELVSGVGIERGYQFFVLKIKCNRHTNYTRPIKK